MNRQQFIADVLATSPEHHTRINPNTGRFTSAVSEQQYEIYCKGARFVCTDTAELAMHLWAGYADHFEDAIDSIDNVSNVTRFVPSLAKASEALGRALRANEVDYSGVFLYDVAQAAGAWLAESSKNITIEEFEAHVDTLVAKGIVK